MLMVMAIPYVMEIVKIKILISHLGMTMMEMVLRTVLIAMIMIQQFYPVQPI